MSRESAGSSSSGTASGAYYSAHKDTLDGSSIELAGPGGKLLFGFNDPSIELRTPGPDRASPIVSQALAPGRLPDAHLRRRVSGDDRPHRERRRRRLDRSGGPQDRPDHDRLPQVPRRRRPPRRRPQLTRRPDDYDSRSHEDAQACRRLTSKASSTYTPTT